jgi:hypothetical protein
MVRTPRSLGNQFPPKTQKKRDHLKEREETDTERTYRALVQGGSVGRVTNSLATFQTMMNSIFTDNIAEKWPTVYMDDMAIHTQRHPEELEEQHTQCHRSYVKRILTKLMKHNVTPQWAYCLLL